MPDIQLLQSIALIIIAAVSLFIGLTYFCCFRRVSKKRKSLQIITPKEQMRLQTLGILVLALLAAVSTSVIVCIFEYL